MKSEHYSWLVDDNDFCVRQGFNGGLIWAGVIQNHDTFGGYNTWFTIPSGIGEYHIHFARNSTRARCIRYKKSSTDAGGTNMFVLAKNTQGLTSASLNDLIHACDVYFPNWKQLLQNFKSAIESVPRTCNNELS